MRITAAVLYDVNKPYSIEPVELDSPKRGEVLVKVGAAGICRSDLHFQKGEATIALPAVLGHEGSGTVEAVGDGVGMVKPGDRVILSFVPNCGHCQSCETGRPHLCDEHARTSGKLFDGTSRLHTLAGQDLTHMGKVACFAEYAVVPEAGCIPAPAGLGFPQMALIGCSVTTGVGAAVFNGGVAPGDSVAVIGCGGVGLSAVQGARLAGASRIVAVDVRPEKTALARKLGATDQVDASAADAVTAVRDLLPDGVDYAFDAIGLTSTTSQAIALLGLGGAAVLVGLPPDGSTVSFEPLVLAESDQRILGSNYGSVRHGVDIPALVDRFMDGDLLLNELISSRAPLESASAALDELEAGRALRTLLIP